MGANIVNIAKYTEFCKNDNSVYLLGNCYGFTSENLFVLLVFFLFSEFICFILFIYWY